MYTYKPTKDYLAHHGIKGMEWYHRRYQYEDGSLTPEGRARYGVKDNDVKGEAEAKGKIYETERKSIEARGKAASNVSSNSSTITKGVSSLADTLDKTEKNVREEQAKKASEMSDEEMKKEINRIMLENQYADVTSKRILGAKQSGKEALKEYLSIAGDVVGVVGGTIGIVTAINALRIPRGD